MWSSSEAENFSSQDPVHADMANLSIGAAADHVNCPVCNASVCRSTLKQHLRHNHGPSDMPFRCSLCNKGFLSQSGLNHHTLAHKGRQFPCHICDARFKQKSHLKNHLNRVHKVAECKRCGQYLRLGEDYNQHVLHCF